mmetsp:Transcript_1541/g.2176  ORF Transcript_1541/g.2176 Transcript_1541/m.2176 type:complete len:403 (-) Transcript_1541:190-1398(-)
MNSTTATAGLVGGDPSEQEDTTDETSQMLHQQQQHRQRQQVILDEEKGNSSEKTKQELSHLVSSESQDDDDENENDNRNEIRLGAAVAEEEEEEEEEQEIFNDEQQQAQALPALRFQRFLHTCAIPDNRASINGIQLVEGPFAVKLLKFVAVTFAGISFMHWFVRQMQWENRKQYTLEMFWTYESTMVVVDATFFFLIARLHKQKGVDHLAWIMVAFLANIYASFITDFRFLQHSVTLFEMHCTWPWALWWFVLLLIPLIVVIVVLHVNYAVKRKTFVVKFLELVLSVVFLMYPYATSPYLHLHHWYVGWLVGMHANFNVWWSRATLAWCWGLYINGIAVYGRDPVLTCGYTLFLSKQQRCPYLDCYLDGLANPSNNNDSSPFVTEMKQPDWRNCSSDAYHP